MALDMRSKLRDGHPNSLAKTGKQRGMTKSKRAVKRSSTRAKRK